MLHWTPEMISSPLTRLQSYQKSADLLIFNLLYCSSANKTKVLFTNRKIRVHFRNRQYQLYLTGCSGGSRCQILMSTDKKCNTIRKKYRLCPWKFYAHY